MVPAPAAGPGQPVLCKVNSALSDFLYLSHIKQRLPAPYYKCLQDTSPVSKDDQKNMREEGFIFIARSEDRIYNCQI